jgi:methionyl aminopeptidase
MNILSALRSQSGASREKVKKTNEGQSSPAPSKGIEIKSKRELEIMRESARIVAIVLKEISEIISPGMTTKDLDTHAEKRIYLALRAITAFLRHFVSASTMKSSTAFLMGDG